MTYDELVKKYDGKYPHDSVNAFEEYSGMTRIEIDSILDSFTNPILFEQDEQGNFKKDSDGNLIRTFEIYEKWLLLLITEWAMLHLFKKH